MDLAIRKKEKKNKNDLKSALLEKRRSIPVETKKKTIFLSMANSIIITYYN